MVTNPPPVALVWPKKVIYFRVADVEMQMSTKPSFLRNQRLPSSYLKNWVRTYMYICEYSLLSSDEATRQERGKKTTLAMLGELAVNRTTDFSKPK